MSDEIKVGAVRVWPNGKEIEVVEQVAEGQFAGEFRYRYLAESSEGILSAEFLLASTRLVSTDTTPSLVELDRREASERALAALIEWRSAVDVKAHIHATIALRKAADGYIAAVLS